ncbi:hypothetical protein AX774_g1463, partial [Zancudomyces culisetae]
LGSPGTIGSGPGDSPISSSLLFGLGASSKLPRDRSRFGFAQNIKDHHHQQQHQQHQQQHHHQQQIQHQMQQQYLHDSYAHSSNFPNQNINPYHRPHQINPIHSMFGLSSTTNDKPSDLYQPFAPSSDLFPPNNNQNYLPIGTNLPLPPPPHLPPHLQQQQQQQQQQSLYNPTNTSSMPFQDPAILHAQLSHDSNDINRPIESSPLHPLPLSHPLSHPHPLPPPNPSQSHLASLLMKLKVSSNLPATATTTTTTTTITTPTQHHFAPLEPNNNDPALFGSDPAILSLTNNSSSQSPSSFFESDATALAINPNSNLPFYPSSSSFSESAGSVPLLDSFPPPPPPPQQQQQQQQQQQNPHVDPLLLQAFDLVRSRIKNSSPSFDPYSSSSVYFPDLSLTLHSYFDLLQNIQILNSNTASAYADSVALEADLKNILQVNSSTTTVIDHIPTN